MATEGAVPRTLPRYRRELAYGWVLGGFPVRELLTHAPGRALEVRWHGDLAGDPGNVGATLRTAAAFSVADVGRGPVSLVAGPEWPGLPLDQLALGEPVRIDQDPRVESLNVTVAVGIALHAPRRMRGAASS